MSGLGFPYNDTKLQLKSLSRAADRDQGHTRAIYELLQDPAHIARCSVCHMVSIKRKGLRKLVRRRRRLDTRWQDTVRSFGKKES